jgi:hypothetical protein
LNLIIKVAMDGGLEGSFFFLAAVLLGFEKQADAKRPPVTKSASGRKF